MADLFENPMGTDGFEFVEYCHKNPQELVDLFTSLGFKKTGTHKSKKVSLWQQGDINFILNEEPEAMAFAADRNGGAARAMGFRVKDAQKAYARALEKGAIAYEGKIGAGELKIPAVVGIGGSVLYFVDVYGDKGSIYQTDFNIHDTAPNPGVGLTYLDHLTHNVNRGNMDKWANFYTDLFNFREIRYFDIEGKLTGLKSIAMTSPVNASAGPKLSGLRSLIASFAAAGARCATSRPQAAAPRLTSAAGTSINDSGASATGARIATKMMTRTSMTAEAAAIPATNTGALSSLSRRRVASAVVTAVEDAIAPVAAMAKVPRVAPNRLLAK